MLRTSQQPRGGTSCAESADRNGVAEKGVEEYYNIEVKLLLQPQRSTTQRQTFLIENF